MIAHKVLIVALVHLSHNLAVAFPEDSLRGSCSCMDGLTDAVKEIAKAMSNTGEIQTCTKPIESTDTRFTNFNPKAEYTVGDTVTVTCKKGFKPINPQTSTCLHNNEWSLIRDCKPACADGYESYGSLCYSISNQKMNFFQAVVYCARKSPQLGSRLLIPDTANKQKDLMDLVRANGFFGSNRKSLWLGASDRFKEGLFLWNDGSVMRFLHQDFAFLPNQPDNIGKGEDCIHLWEKGGVNDVRCTDSYWSVPICEVP